MSLLLCCRSYRFRGIRVQLTWKRQILLEKQKAGTTSTFSQKRQAQKKCVWSTTIRVQPCTATLLPTTSQKTNSRWGVFNFILTVLLVCLSLVSLPLPSLPLSVYKMSISECRSIFVPLPVSEWSCSSFYEPMCPGLSKRCPLNS